MDFVPQAGLERERTKKKTIFKNNSSLLYLTMSLEDKFYPDDESYLTRFDNFMIKAAKEFGVLYQNLTGDSYKNLVKTLNKVSALGFGISALCGHIPLSLLSIINYKQSKTRTYSTPLEEEIRFEALGVERKLGKLVRISTLTFGSVGAFMGYSNDIDKNNNPFIYFFYLGSMIAGSSFYFSTFADYLSLSDMPNPPDKTLFEKAGEKIRKLLSPQPLPTQTYSPILLENRKGYHVCQ